MMHEAVELDVTSVEERVGKVRDALMLLQKPGDDASKRHAHMQRTTEAMFL